MKEDKAMESVQHAPFGELLQQLRKRKKIKQQQLADKLGIHRNTIGGWERGDYLPETRGMVLELANQLSLNDQETRQLLEASLTALATYWQVPYQRNPLFTGREDILDQLHEVLSQQETAILSQSYALSGLGGIGKTQTAIEYIYRHANEYAAVFWIGAETYERIASDFLAFAEVLSLPERQEQDQSKVMAAVQRWLSSHKGWLLIFDNVEDLELVKRVQPAARSGAVLLTTRLQALGVAAQTIDLEKMSMEEGLDFLLRRAKVPASGEQLNPTEEAAAREIVSVMDGLPLALDQAGAYIEATRCSFSDYLHLFQNHPIDLLNEREAYADHPASVARTFALAFEQLQQRNPAATELLSVCAFLAPDAIPEELFTEGACQLGPAFEQMATHPLQFHAAVKDLLAYSLIHRNPTNKTLTIHRLVQAVLKASMEEAVQRDWIKRLIKALNQLLPSREGYMLQSWNTEHWPQNERLLPHALEAAILSKRWNLTFSEVSSLPIKAAVYLSRRARLVEAEPLLLQALSLREQTLGPEHPDIAQPLYELGYIYTELGKYTEAEPLLLRALRILEQSLSPEHSDLAYPLNHLGDLYARQGKYAEAEPLLQRTLRIWEQALGPEHPSVAEPLNNLGFLYNEQGNYTTAEPLLQRTLRIREQALGPEHPHVAEPLNNLGLLYNYQGQYREAEPLLLRALRIREQALGSEHPDVAYILNNLAFLYTHQGKYAQAEPLLQRTLLIFEQALGSEHPHVAYPLNNLGWLYNKQGNYTAAEPLLLRALHIREQALEPEHLTIAQTLNNLGFLYAHQSKYTQAEPLLLRALHIKERELGSEHLDIASTLNNLGFLYAHQSKYTQAELLLLRALHIWEQTLGSNHLETADSLHNLAELYHLQGKLAEAEPLYQRALTIREQQLGTEHSKTVETRSRYTALLEEISSST